MSARSPDRTLELDPTSADLPDSTVPPPPPPSSPAAGGPRRAWSIGPPAHLRQPSASTAERRRGEERDQDQAEQAEQADGQGEASTSSDSSSRRHSPSWREASILRHVLGS